jgi:hypothetical protein
MRPKRCTMETQASTQREGGAVHRLRALTRTHSAATRTIIVLSLTCAVIVGLVTMHTLSGGGLGHDQSGVALAPFALDSEAAHGHHAEVEEAAPCDCTQGAPLEGHSMLTMACVLALLLPSLALGAPLGTWRLLPRPRQLGTSSGGLALAAPRVATPSLHVLSISRT